MNRLRIVQEIDPAYHANPYRIIEKIFTVDGPRDRITDHSYSSMAEAEEAIAKEVQPSGFDVPSNFDVYCMEHKVQLNLDGTCPECRNAQGQPFVLDMQSIYLVRRGT